MIPEGYAAALHAWATSPELSAAEKDARGKMFLSQRDALVTGATKGASLKDLVQASVNGKTFQWETGISKAEMLTVVNDVLMRLGLTSAESLPIKVTHATFCGLQR